MLLSSKHDDKDVKIADFGFAKIASVLSLTTQCGSPGCVAPEILENKKYGTEINSKVNPNAYVYVSI